MGQKPVNSQSIRIYIHKAITVSVEGFCVINFSLSLSLSTYAPVKQFLRVDKDKVCIISINCDLTHAHAHAHTCTRKHSDQLRCNYISPSPSLVKDCS